MVRLRLALLAAPLALACNQGGTISATDMEIVDAMGENPVESMDGTITVVVRHAGELLDCAGAPCTGMISDGTFELVLPIASFEGRTRAHVDIRAEGGRRFIGATPVFAPFGEGVDILRKVRVVVGPPGVCRPLELDGLARGEPVFLRPARTHVAAVQRRNIVLLAGGEDDAGDPDDHVDQLDQTTFDAHALPSWSRPAEIGAARGLALSEDISLVVGTHTFLFLLADRGQPTSRELTLHERAGFASALVDLGGDGAAVVAGEATDRVTWIGLDGGDRGSTVLTTSRTSPVAARVAGGVLVVGGAEGGPRAEWMAPMRDATPLESLAALPSGRGGHLVPSPDGRAALYLGWTGEDGLPSTDTFLITGCPDACEAGAGPAWPDARLDVASVTTDAGATWLIGGELEGEASQRVDRILWDGRAPRIEPLGIGLAAPRAGATAFENASGIVIVAGGRSDGVALRDMEICFPPELDPL